MFELEKVWSWRSGNEWWSPELDFGRGEALDDLHRFTALGAAIKGRSVLGGGGALFGGQFLRCAEQVKAKGQSGGTPAVG